MWGSWGVNGPPDSTIGPGPAVKVCQSCLETQVEGVCPLRCSGMLAGSPALPGGLCSQRLLGALPCGLTWPGSAGSPRSQVKCGPPAGSSVPPRLDLALDAYFSDICNPGALPEHGSALISVWASWITRKRKDPGQGMFLKVTCLSETFCCCF